MLPDVDAQDRDALGALHAVHERVVLVRGGGDHELAIREHEPDPAGAEASAGRGGSLPLLLEGIHGAEGILDGPRELRGGLATRAGGRHLEPEEVVVVGAAAAVAEGCSALDRGLLEIQDRGMVLALQGLVDVRDVGVVVIVVVELHRGLVDGGLQGIVGVGQRHQVVGLRLARTHHGGRGVDGA